MYACLRGKANESPLVDPLFYGYAYTVPVRHTEDCYTYISLASHTFFHKNGKGLVNGVYKPCPTTPCSAVQSHYSILSHDTLHHHLSSSSGLENGDRQVEHLLCYYRSCKSTLTILLGEGAHFTTGIII